jgi:hypothetical protein
MLNLVDHTLGRTCQRNPVSLDKSSLKPKIIYAEIWFLAPFVTPTEKPGFFHRSWLKPKIIYKGTGFLDWLVSRKLTFGMGDVGFEPTASCV